jgi:hypothetical protein
MLLRASFLTRVPSGLGVKFDRLVAFTYGAAKDSQTFGLATLLWKCSTFRSMSNGDAQHIVVLGYPHESDSTQQQLAQQLIQTFGRRAAKRLPTEVLNQRGTWHARLAIVDRTTGTVTAKHDLRYDWHSRSVVLMAKTACFVKKALEIGMPLCLNSDDWPAWKTAIGKACDTFVLDQHGDPGSNNAPAFRDIACQVSEVAQSLNDCSACEIHTLQAVKNSVEEVKADVGKLFCLANV